MPATFHETVNEFEEELLPVVANRLFVFDMDGTLLIRTTACIEIAKVSGTLDHLHILEQQFAAGEMDAFSFAQSVGGLWGVVDEQLVRTAFEAPKLANIKKSRLSYGKREANPAWPVTSLRFSPNLHTQRRVGRPFLAARRLSSRRQQIPQPTVTPCSIRHRRRLG